MEMNVEKSKENLKETSFIADNKSETTKECGIF
jgi:hypothetical protein